jgi:CheY-like chemotaxis protein
MSNNLFLLADDIEVNNKILSKVLFNVDPEAVVLSFTSGDGLIENYIELLKSNYQPTAIMLDQKMPGLTGLETANKLRNMSAETAAPYEGPIIIVTGENDPMQYKDPENVTEVITKPVTMIKINDVLRDCNCI